MTTVYRVLLVGFGAAGQGFAQILRDHGARIAASTGADIRIVGVATARRGSAYAADCLNAGRCSKRLHRVHLRHCPRR